MLIINDRHTHLRTIEAACSACTRCNLHRTRTRTVFGRGNEHDPPIAFVGEGPGELEDREGVPFVGPSGQLLDRMVQAIGFKRDEVYVCNVVKCRPPGNRTPSDYERETCAKPFLAMQLELVRPRVIVALGRTAATALGISGVRWRGRWANYHGFPTLATYHPAYVLRAPEAKSEVWTDLMKALERLGRAVPN